VGVHTNEAGNFELIRQALSSLQLAYRNRGWATVSLALPQQRITNGIVTIQVTEGRLSEVTVVGNKWFSERNVRAALPSAKTNTVLNSKVFQAEVDQANASPDRQIYPVIEPGAEPGTSMLVLKVKDQVPLHGRFELNNQRTPGTPQLRGASSAQYNNLWDRDHTLGLQYGFAMQQFKDGPDVALLDRPAIANYSGFYRMPLNSEPPMEDVIRRNPNRFGFDEGSRQYRLPPPSRRSELNLYASRFTTDTGTKETPLRQLNPPPIELLQNESGQDLSTIQTAGFKVSTPVPSFLGALATVTFGAEAKSYSASSFNTNNFISRTTFQDPVLGPTTLENRSSIPQPGRFKDISYLPLNLRLDASRPDSSGVTSAGMGVIGVMAGGPFSRRSTFERAVSAEASGDFAVLQSSLARQQRLPGDWTLIVRADGQWSTQPLLPVEQFGLGGLAGVRGYLEGARFGDAGWRVTGEAKMPTLDLGVVDGTMPVRLTPSVFMDYGQSFAFARTYAGATPAQDYHAPASMQPLWGTGIGITGTVGGTFDFRLATAWALQEIATSKAGTVQLYFGMAVQF
jgi:hemolysin activation/secretion protein